MIQAMLPGALTVALLTTPTAAAPVTPSAQFFQSSPIQEQKLIWVVKPGETLLSIAKDYYGDEKFWTTLWNDNQTITDPNVISPDEVLALRKDAPKEPEEVSPVLKATYPNTQYTYTAPVVESVPTPTTPVNPSQPPVSPTSAPQATSNYSGGPLTEEQLTFLGNCEAGMNPTRNSGNGYYGAFQFSYGTWKSMGTAYERADLAPIEVQKDAVQRLLSRSSIYTQFPGCARKMQSIGLL